MREADRDALRVWRMDHASAFTDTRKRGLYTHAEIPVYRVRRQSNDDAEIILVRTEERPYQGIRKTYFVGMREQHDIRCEHQGKGVLSGVNYLVRSATIILAG